MKDSFGREINYLRISLTQRCNLNCMYCGCSKPDTDELSCEEIELAVRAFASVGIRKVRLTGGEPLIREDITDIARRVSAVNGIEKTVLTTNGIKLKSLASQLRDAGVNAVNISLDSLDRERYSQITGRDALPLVLEGMEEAIRVGLTPVRLNAVAIRGINDESIGELIGFAMQHPVDVRFIELMPFSDTGDDQTRVIKAQEILDRFPFLEPVPSPKDGTVAKYYTADGFQGKIGFITPVSDKFCHECNRIRLLSDGRIRPCLGHEQTVDIRPYLYDTHKLTEIITRAILSKPKGHFFECACGNIRAMNKIGG